MTYSIHQVVSLFYIDSQDDTLLCLEWDLNEVSGCALNLPTIAIAPDSRQVSAIWLLSNHTLTKSLLLIFQEPSHKLVVLQGIQPREVNANAPWTWLNQTDRFKSALVQVFRELNKTSMFIPTVMQEVVRLNDLDLIHSCIAGSFSDTRYPGKAFYLNCFWDWNDKSYSKMKYSIVQFSFEVDSRTANITILNSKSNRLLRFIWAVNLSHVETMSADRVTSLIPNSESNLMSMQFSKSTGWVAGDRIYFESPVPGSPKVYYRPSLNVSFPSQRLSTTSPVNTTKTYLYHQIDDKTLGEEYWDGTSGFWLSSNITIDVA